MSSVSISEIKSGQHCVAITLVLVFLCAPPTLIIASMILSSVVFALFGLACCSAIKDTPVQYGKAVIIMSAGRGGSTWFADVVKKTSLLNKAPLSYELMGHAAWDMKKVTDPTGKAIAYLNDQRRESPRGLVGFKIKPYVDNEQYDALYQHLAAEKVPVLYLTRNPLDKIISGEKHSAFEVKAHCLKGDHKCIAKHAENKPVVDTKTLVQSLDEARAAHENVIVKLKTLKVNFLHVSYDKLGFGCDEEKVAILQQILGFIYPDKKLTADINTLRTKYEATSDRNQTNVMHNYDEVAATLKGTVHENLLRTADPPCPSTHR